MTRTPLTPARLTEDQPLGKPPSMSDEQCGTLYVRAEAHPHFPHTPVLYSRWMLTPEQRQQIGEGTHEILLGVVGGHPPVMLYTSDEENDIHPTEGTLIDPATYNPPFGWVLIGPDGNWYWSRSYDDHESITFQRPATHLEQLLMSVDGFTTSRRS